MALSRLPDAAFHISVEQRGLRNAGEELSVEGKGSWVAEPIQSLVGEVIIASGCVAWQRPLPSPQVMPFN